jgi:hypothetical protein
MMSCGELAAILNRAAAKAEVGLVEPTKAAMAVVEDKAKTVIGTYEYGWPELAERTQKDRVALGFSANDPLLRAGSLRDSIEHRAEPTATGAEGLVYSDEKTALWAEMGTSRGEPPRSFLMQSLIRSEPEMARIFGEFAESLFAP